MLKCILPSCCLYRHSLMSHTYACNSVFLAPACLTFQFLLHPYKNMDVLISDLSTGHLSKQMILSCLLNTNCFKLLKTFWYELFFFFFFPSPVSVHSTEKLIVLFFPLESEGVCEFMKESSG